jgi:hypothetical protein
MPLKRVLWREYVSEEYVSEENMSLKRNTLRRRQCITAFMLFEQHSTSPSLVTARLWLNSKSKNRLELLPDPAVAIAWMRTDEPGTRSWVLGFGIWNDDLGLEAVIWSPGRVGSEMLAQSYGCKLGEVLTLGCKARMNSIPAVVLHWGYA